jgi:hypothetical protein
MLRHEARAPQLIAHPPVIHGALDRELVRRVVRRHLNEVRFCYERELVGHPELAGRLVVQFVIGGDGRVVSAVGQSSTLGAPELEGCIVSAVRRWEFPKSPQGAGSVMVSYPFQLAVAGR